MKRTRKPPPTTIMANDPSMTAWGWVVLSAEGLVLDAGTIKTEPATKKLRIRKGDDRIRRVSELVQALINIIKKHNVSLILSELPHGSQSAQAAIMMGMVAGIVQTLSIGLNIPVEWYSEQDAKRSLLGKKSASKREIMDRVETWYSQEGMMNWRKYVKWQDEAIADALAVYHVARQQSELLKIISK